MSMNLTWLEQMIQEMNFAPRKKITNTIGGGIWKEKYSGWRTWWMIFVSD